MTQTTPPGWHPDPGHSGIGPVQERWWDGSRWTDQLRIPPATVRRRRIRVGAGITAGVVLLAAVGGGAYLLGVGNSGDGHSTSTAESAPSDPPGGPDADGGRGGGGQDGDGRSREMPGSEDGYATDLASGISIPVPDGWTGQSGAIGAGVTTGEYACPGDESQSCVLGGVFSAPAQALEVTATTSKAAAQEDIKTNAEQSYGEKIYGGITSHEQLKSEAVTVAGQEGYRVRWKVVTKNGDDGYVESLAFPSPNSPDSLIVIRSGFDINDKAPKLSVLDDITKGVKKATGLGSGSGSGRGA